MALLKSSCLRLAFSSSHLTPSLSLAAFGKQCPFFYWTKNILINEKLEASI